MNGPRFSDENFTIKLTVIVLTNCEIVAVSTDVVSVVVCVTGTLVVAVAADVIGNSCVPECIDDVLPSIADAVTDKVRSLVLPGPLIYARNDHAINDLKAVLSVHCFWTAVAGGGHLTSEDGKPTGGTGTLGGNH